MKYMSEYQRSYQKRTPAKFSEQSAEERKLSQAPRPRSAASPSRRPRPTQEPRRDAQQNFALIGPHEKLSESRLYRLKEPVPDRPRLAKSQEFAILGRNEKLENNVIYPMRQPVLSDSPRIVVRRPKTKHQSVGTQAELRQAPSASYAGREAPQRKRLEPQSEYRSQYDGKQPHQDLAYHSMSLDNVRWRERSAPAVSSPKKTTSVAVNTPARVDIDVDQRKPSAKPVKYNVKKSSGTEQQRKSNSGKHKQVRRTRSFEAEQIDQRKPQERVEPERAQSDDEGTVAKQVDLGREFQQRNPHGKLKRWKSEYQSTFKPFWRFDYKDGKWYKDSSAEETGFNPNLYWYKELLSTRRRADEFRVKAETDHFNPEHTLQLQTGFNGRNPYRAWDTDDDNNEADSVISIDRDLERERIEGEQRREKDAKPKPKPKPKPQHKPAKPIEYSPAKTTDRVIPVDYQQDRIIYVDAPRPKPPSAATKAFVRNLSSNSVAQHMSWESESLYTERSNSDLDYQSLAARNAYRKSPIKKFESRGTGTHSSIPTDRSTIKSQYSSPRKSDRPSSSYGQTRPSTMVRPTYETQPFESRPAERPHSNIIDQPLYGGSRFKDEVTDYYYGNDHQYVQPKNDAFVNGSARSLSSSTSLALQTLERAQQNQDKFWNDRSPHSMTSPKKPINNKY